ncbi:MAG TPA: 50S ribosomal protein L29 [Pseudomonadales bacterium]|nr:50S ribosomal protein L29 [Pseudomonadales bacterium]
MKANKLREMSPKELNEELLARLKQQFNLRMQKSIGQLTKTHELRQVRREIAQIKTVLNEKQGS